MAWTQADLDTLKQAYASGALRVTLPNAGSVEYRSLADMRAIISDVSKEIAATSGRAPAPRIVKIVAAKGL